MFLIKFWVLDFCCSVTKLYPTHCDPLDHSTSSFPVLHYLPECAQSHVYWVSDAIQPSHPVTPFSSCPQSFPGVGSFLMSGLKVLEFQLQHQSFQWILRTDSWWEALWSLACWGWEGSPPLYRLRLSPLAAGYKQDFHAWDLLASWICALVSFTSSRNCSVMISSQIFASAPFVLSVWDVNYMCVRPLSTVSLTFPSPSFLFFFFSLCRILGNSSLLSFTLLILCSTASKLLLN